ncbi:hypothetical protein GGS21DRAFT_401907 [Xylaria nigripes]|nr:hypothetical protein GGS21DRAFT_401907 [Xylaria nigripes]
MADPQLSAATDDSECESLPPELATSLEIPSMKCCCGSPECVFLRHNYAILNNVEKDVHQAARMGQALLARHESYMADAERDRTELTARIEQLEHENRELEMKIAKMAEENKDLLLQLDALNTTIIDTEVHMKTLEATLLSSQQTIRRLELETARAEALERQIASLEQEQAEIHGSLLLSREEARSAISRWKRAERGINDLQEQLERIEKEAKKEREHHVEMMSRLEKQREMEKELNTAAGRLKGAAAARFMSQGNGGANVVGHFVRDLLQDNANLQCGIAELREMLMNSNDEIQALRDQLEYHQPLGDIAHRTAPTLMAELEMKQSPVHERSSPSVSQALHIHHHYHLPAQRQETRKPRKKRPGLSAGVFIPPSVAHPSTPPNGVARYSSMSRSRKNSERSNRWSNYSEQPSEFALSSVTSSPHSNRRNSVFDPPAGSFPASPSSSIDPMSPDWPPVHKRLPPSITSRNLHAPTYFHYGPASPGIGHPIAEEPADGADIPVVYSPTTGDSVADDEVSSPEFGAIEDGNSSELSDITSSDCQPAMGRLCREVSYESIVSLSGGLDIHTLKSRPSQINSIGQLGSASSVTGSSIITARPMLFRDSARKSSVILRDRFGPTPVGGEQSRDSNVPTSQQSKSSKLGKWVGWRPWGGQSSSNNTSRAQESVSTAAKASKEVDATKHQSRPHGINQAGAVPGFSEYLAAAAKSKAPACQVTPQVVDHEALREGLRES